MVKKSRQKKNIIKKSSEEESYFYLFLSLSDWSHLRQVLKDPLRFVSTPNDKVQPRGSKPKAFGLPLSFFFLWRKESETVEINFNVSIQNIKMIISKLSKIV